MQMFRSFIHVLPVLALMLMASLVCGPVALASPAPQSPDSRHRQIAQRGLDLVMNGDPDGAIEVFYEIRRDDSQSPLGYLLEADATWWKIYFATGNLIDPDVFDFVSAPSTPYDSHFEGLIHATIAKSEARIGAGQDVARNYLYEGMAYAIQARLNALRGKRLPTARAGKKMRARLLKALELDPQLTDAYLGIGTYNYFVDTLPTIIKILKFFIGLPGGSRELGLEQLQRAADHGELTRGEAGFYLAKNFSRGNERQYAKSLELFATLRKEYPHNPLWPLMVGSLHIRLGHIEEGEALYREVYKMTKGEKSEVQQVIHRAVKHALELRHPGEELD
jgi:tetratricopeptide (TPR) repeat protein